MKISYPNTAREREREGKKLINKVIREKEKSNEKENWRYNVLVQMNHHHDSEG